jgi:hypothetical protein
MKPESMLKLHGSNWRSTPISTATRTDGKRTHTPGGALTAARVFVVSLNTCAECGRLRSEARLRAQAYELALHALRVPPTLSVEYNELQAAADEARINFQLARVELAEHQRQHRVQTAEWQ